MLADLYVYVFSLSPGGQTIASFVRVAVKAISIRPKAITELCDVAQLRCVAQCVTKRRNGRPVDTSRNKSRKPSKAHAQASDVSPPTQANKTTKQQPAEHAYTSPNRQPTYQLWRRTSVTSLQLMQSPMSIQVRSTAIKAARSFRACMPSGLAHETIVNRSLLETVKLKFHGLADHVGER